MAHLPSSRNYPSSATGGARLSHRASPLRRARTAVERRPAASRSSHVSLASTTSQSPPRRCNYERRGISNNSKLKPWEVEPEWRRKQRKQVEREASAEDMELVSVGPKMSTTPVESRTIYEELSPENMSDSANMAATYGIGATAKEEKKSRPTRPPSSSTRLGPSKTVQRSKRTRPHTCGAGKRDESGSEGEEPRLRAASEVDLFGGVDILDDKGWDTDLEQEDQTESYDHSGRTTYIEACRKAGVVPASYYLRHMHDSELHMKHHGLGAQGMKPIAISLVSNTSVTCLDLSDNWLGPKGGAAVMDMLKENCYMTDVNLADNHCGPSIVGQLRNVMEVNTTINKLILCGNDLGDASVPVLAEAVASNQRIEILDLSHNNFGEISGILLGPAIAENTSLRSLDLSWNCLRRKGAVAVAQGIKHNVFMKKINLSWNGMGNDGAKSLGDALRANNTLEELNLSNNRITTEGAVLLGKGIAVNETLATLKLGRNPMQSAGCFAIIAAALKCPSSGLHSVDFSEITVNQDFRELLARASEQLPLLDCQHGAPRSRQLRRSRPHPMLKLTSYVQRNNLKIIDFFNKFDKDGSMSVTREEFLEGLEALLQHRVTRPDGKEIGIGLDEAEVNLLLEELDKDGDGEINYSELMVATSAPRYSQSAGSMSRNQNSLSQLVPA